MKKSLQRKRPAQGTVVCIPLPKGHYADGVTQGGRGLWLYNFISRQPFFDLNLLQPVNWFQHVSCHQDAIGADTFDVGHVILTTEQQKDVKTWERVSRAALEDGAPTPYKAYDPNLPNLSEQFYFITEAELPQYQEYLMFTPKQMLDYLEQNRPRFQVVEVDPAKVIAPQNVAENATFDPVSIFEIWLSGLELMKLTEMEDIKDELDAELEHHQAGYVMGSGQVDGQDQHNIAVQNAPGKNKQALDCIRRVLKRLKANPETTDIWEQKPDAEDHIKRVL